MTTVHSMYRNYNTYSKHIQYVQEACFQHNIWTEGKSKRVTSTIEFWSDGREQEWAETYPNIHDETSNKLIPTTGTLLLWAKYKCMTTSASFQRQNMPKISERAS